MSALATPGAAELGLEPPVAAAVAELLLGMADDEFVLGFWDSEWTGIAPVLEEDVAFSSLAQDEIGHAQALYELLAQLTGTGADELAFGREADEYRHAALLDHARGDWAFSIARRFLYDTADAVRLDALAGSSLQPLAGLAAKMRREEAYHLAHVHAWMRRLAGPSGSPPVNGGSGGLKSEAGTQVAGGHLEPSGSPPVNREPRRRLREACERLWPDALTVLTLPDGEGLLLEAGILPEPLDALRQRWLAELAPLFAELELPFPFRRAGGRLEPTVEPPAAGRRHRRGEDFRWLWGEFTSVYRSEPGATW
jgi:ring-1,2-phenylacetyl-CoA epoxidase subunit PaaC